MNTSTAIKPLAYSTKVGGDIVLPAGVNFVQRRGTTQPHRKLSRITVSPEATPIWQQQILRPSITLQQRFSQGTEPVEYVRPSISLTADTNHQSLPIIQETSVAPPHKEQQEETFSLEPVAIPPTPASDEPQEEEQERSDNNSSSPGPSLSPDIELTEPSYISDDVKEKLPVDVDNKNPSTKPKTHAQLNATLQQLEETLTNIDNTIMADLSSSLEQITGLRNKIQEQEQKLKQLNTAESAEDLDVDMKTKKALLDNLKHALDNTQIELAELEKEPSADTALIAQLREQLAQQKRSFDQLQRENKELLEKQGDSAAAPQPQKQAPPPLPAAQQVTTTGSTPKITTVPNAINGTVTDPTGKLITGAVVIIKSGDNRPLRALKTNQLGQYWVTTALENGSYLIETEAQGLTFDTVAIELHGDVVPPIAITAK